MKPWENRLWEHFQTDLNHFFSTPSGLLWTSWPNCPVWWNFHAKGIDLWAATETWRQPDRWSSPNWHNWTFWTTARWVISIWVSVATVTHSTQTNHSVFFMEVNVLLQGDRLSAESHVFLFNICWILNSQIQRFYEHTNVLIDLHKSAPCRWEEVLSYSTYDAEVYCVFLLFSSDHLWRKEGGGAWLHQDVWGGVAKGGGAGSAQRRLHQAASPLSKTHWQ